jgi:hypothetical protein
MVDAVNARGVHEAQAEAPMTMPQIPNESLHAAMFGLMAVAALALTAKQAVLAILIVMHHRDPSLPAQALPAGMLAVVIGLWMTFILGSISSMALDLPWAHAGSGIFSGMRIDVPCLAVTTLLWP